MNNGKLGEQLFAQYMCAQGYIVNDVSKDQSYFDKDIDFFCANPSTGNTKSFEVKWDERIGQTNNLFLEMRNPRSKQWNGQGWWLHCQADFLVYGDAQNRIFYIFPLLELRQRVKNLSLRYKTTNDYSEGYLLPLDKVRDLAVEVRA